MDRQAMTDRSATAMPTSGDAGSGAKVGRKLDHQRDADILAATIEVLAEVGYEAMTVEQVAARIKAGKSTVYRRWPTKAGLVVEAVLNLGRLETPITNLPDTGSLRGDLMALITVNTPDDQRKLQIIAGLIPELRKSPELAVAVSEQIVRPRIALVRALIRRAEDRGEIQTGLDLDLIAQLLPAMIAYRLIVLDLPTDPSMQMHIVDSLLLPSVGPDAASRRPTRTSDTD